MFSVISRLAYTLALLRHSVIRRDDRHELRNYRSTSNPDISTRSADIVEFVNINIVFNN